MLNYNMLEASVLSKLSKTPKARGFFTPDRIRQYVQEGLDSLATEMFLGGNGFSNKIRYIDTLPNQVAVPIPRDVCYINQVRYLVGNVYEPCPYDEGREKPMWDNTQAGSQLYPYTYRIVDNCFYFNPPVIQGGSKFLMLETTVWPKMPQNPSDYFDVMINPAFKNWMTYYIVIGAMSDFGQNAANSDWSSQMSYWYDKMKEIIQRRNNQAQRIGDFE